MKGMVVRRRGSIEESPLILEEVPDPQPGPGEIRVRIRACGICRTDLHVIEGELPPKRSPLIPGHQIVGVVDKAGGGSDRFRVGDRVGIAWLRWTCGSCGMCRAGRENLCEQSLFTGYHADGGFAQYALIHQDFAYPLPDVFPDRAATPLLCAGIIGYRALRRSKLEAGQKLGIYGFGSSAHIVIQIAHHRGCSVYVCTRGERHRQMAHQMGAAWVGKAAQMMPAKVDSAIVFAPAGELVPVALRSLRKGGTLALAGIYMTSIPAMDYEQCLFYERNVHSVTANTRQDGHDLLREAAEIPILPRTQPFPLEDANRALQLLKADQIEGTGVLVLEH